MTQRKVVFISGPISNGGRMLPIEQYDNVQYASEIAKRLIRLGYAVVVPHLTWYIDRESFTPEYNQWLDSDVTLVRRSDYVLRLPGESYGADIEVEAAREEGITVLYGQGGLEVLEEFASEGFAQLSLEGAIA